MAAEENNIKYKPLSSGTAIPNLPGQYQVPLNSLFTSVFGILSPMIRRYHVPPEEKNNNTFYFEIGETNQPEVSEDTIQSYLGTPINFWMKFNKGTYKKRFNGELKDVQREDMYLPHASVATFSRAKRYTETYMSGQEGSVIEEYGFEPWDIRIQGFILNNAQEGDVEAQVKLLSKWEGLSDAIEVSGRVFEWLQIKKLSIRKIDFMPSKTLNLESVMPFEISARSVTAVELIQS